MPCQHHWLIESPNGPTCQGRCKLCGEERGFQNSNEKFNWVQEPQVFGQGISILKLPSDALGPMRIEEGCKE